MPLKSRNIEIKARVRDYHCIIKRIETFAEAPIQIISQEDTYIRTTKGRLKLRVVSSSDSAQLIYYCRPDIAGPKCSAYRILEVQDPAAMKKIMEDACGVLGVIRKVRRLYLEGQTRIHLDDVEGLGRFLELEVVLRPGQSNEEGKVTAISLMTKLGIYENDLLVGSYLDLMDGRKRMKRNFAAISGCAWVAAVAEIMAHSGHVLDR